MSETEPRFIEVGGGGDRRRIATLSQAGSSPGLMWLQGFRSDMVSTKASALAQWATTKGLALTRFDYSGHGQSSGLFEEGTLSRWLEEARAVFGRLTQGPQVLVGSSMGGGIALVLLRRLMEEQPAEAGRIKALVLIAPAWDMTEELMWKKFPPDTRREVMETGVWLRPSQYGDPYPITRALIEDGRRNLLGSAPWNPGRPIVIVHGRLDPDVPYSHSERLLGQLEGDWARIVEVPDGEHRLARLQDIDLLLSLIEGVAVV